MINKDFEHLVNYHWDIFLSLVLKYYPIPISIIDTYSEEIEWRTLSSNKTIFWTKEVVKKYV